MQISLSGQVFVFPRVCVCCGEQPDTQISVSLTQTKGKKTRTQSWPFPCCSDCLNHHKAISSAILLPNAAFWLGVTLAISALTLTSRYPIISLLLAISGICFMVYGYRQKKLNRTQARIAKRKKTCIADDPHTIVRYMRWEGNLHVFNISSESYAFAFMQANQQKLVNMPNEIIQRLNTYISAHSVAKHYATPAKTAGLKAPKGTPVQSVTPSMVTSTLIRDPKDVEQRLSRLAELRDKEIITANEYETQRQNIINGV